MVQGSHALQEESELKQDELAQGVQQIAH